ncbi:PilT/PilU family type 4a pilus ATPase [Parasulfuritortus cantonensis]|uniref:PilT/PilU family type 4a pilus ATPase n=1 Tax=Parasulfuritortus cantonensis TaxID=2528202 RepID=A0A4R1BH40_9PROT|nr:PilT/PilU family type 4a pilus ATPase [Parasulfuritortus cantonensis]TCJ16511.1 PilT/PilU family type 4a pilus ATPase [Parasulfuritortus cantonensis]
MVNVAQLLEAMAKMAASDLFFTAGARVSMKIEGLVRPIASPELTPADVRQLAYSIMTEDQIKRYETSWEMNFGYSLAGVGRFRINVFRQRGAVAMVVRRLSAQIPDLPDLGLPPVLGRLVNERRGLILVVGSTGSGKSTTMASMLSYRNLSSSGHILTIEDPIEFIFRHQKSIVNQREIGTDTESYETALINALRESPDMIMIGEIRERSTMQEVINFANTGHLCLSTLHAINAHQALTRIVNFFPLETRATVLFDLASCLLGIIGQRLVRGVDGKRLPAIEVFVADYHMKQLIREGRLDEIKDMMERGGHEDMQSFDQAIVKLYKAGRIDLDEARANADSPRQFHLLVHGEDAEPAAAGASSGARANSRAAAALPEIEM